MPMKVRYTVLDGEIVEENRGGVISDYVADPLGSTVALLDGSHSKSDTFNYWPYGEVQSRSGSTPTPFQFVGTLGYYRDSSSRTYVRRKVFNTRLGVFYRQVIQLSDTVADLSYGYVLDNPTSYVDPVGLSPQQRRGVTVRSISDALDKVCGAATIVLGQDDLYERINQCVAESGASCPVINRAKMLCLQNFACNATRKINVIYDDPKVCHCQDPPCAKIEYAEGSDRGRPDCLRLSDRKFNVYVCAHVTTSGCNPLQTQYPVTDAVMHEILHCCKIYHGAFKEPNTCNSIITCCILKATGFNPPNHRCFRSPLVRS